MDIGHNFGPFGACVCLVEYAKDDKEVHSDEVNEDYNGHGLVPSINTFWLYKTGNQEVGCQKWANYLQP